MASDEHSDRDASRVHWWELFFDLVFVALIGALAAPMRLQPDFATLAVFVVLFAAVWWSWVNLVFAVSVMPDLSQRALGGVMLVALTGVGALAVAAPEALGERSWLFAAGNALLRLVLLALWMRRSWGGGRASRVRVVAYNGAAAVLWGVAVALPHPADFILWAVAVAWEIVLMVATAGAWAGGALQRANIEYLAERFGLLVVIALGESVLAIVTAASDAWSWASGATALVGMALLALLAWSFFLFGLDTAASGLESLRRRGEFRAVRDAVGFLPYVLLVGVMVLSGALAVAVADPRTMLPPASAVSLGGGIALFYLGNAAVSWRFGVGRATVAVWALPAVVLAAAVAAAGFVVPAGVAVALGAAAVAASVAASEFRRRRRMVVTSTG